jgi:membrane protein
LRELQRARSAPPHGLTIAQFANGQRIDPLQVEPLVELLVTLGWVGRLDEEGGKRHVLLCDAASTLAEPLIDQLLLARDARTQPFRQRAGLGQVTLAELIGA